MLALILGLVAALGWGTHDFLVRRVSPGATVLPQLAIVTLVAAVLTTPFSGSALPPLLPAAFAAASGLVYFGASLGLYGALARAPARLVTPVISAYPLPALAIAWAQGRPIGGAEWVAAALIVAGLGVVAAYGEREDRHLHPAALPMAVLACLGLATSFALGQEAAARIGPLPAAGLARGFGAAFGLGLVALRPAGMRAALGQGRVLTAMGTLDALALAAVIGAGALAQARFASVASSLFGVVTILLARTLLGERVRAMQGVGMALVFSGLACLAWG